MKKVMLILGFSFLVTVVSFAKTVVEISYPYPKLFKDVHEKLEVEFEKKHPEIDVRIRAGAVDYEEETQRVLRQSLVKQMPDVTFQGLNRIRIFADKNLAVDLNQFINKNKDGLKKIGFDSSLYDAGTFNGKVFGVPFAVSLPIAYYNVDLMKKAGWNSKEMPSTWDDVIKMAKMVNALGEKNVTSMNYAWDISGNWYWQALVFSQGGAMLSSDEKKIAFDGEEGKWSINILKRFVDEAKMPYRNYNTARTDFIAGKVGAYFSTTAELAPISNGIGNNFELKTAAFPNVKKKVGKLPVGGNGAIMLAQDPEKQKAAFEVIKFWCGPEGSKIVAQMTGYMPPNQIAAKELKTEGFYKDNPNNLTAVLQLPLMTGWYAFPGKDSLKITEIINDNMESIINHSEKDTNKVLKKMSEEVKKYLP